MFLKLSFDERRRRRHRRLICDKRAFYQVKNEKSCAKPLNVTVKGKKRIKSEVPDLYTYNFSDEKKMKKIRFKCLI